MIRTPRPAAGPAAGPAKPGPMILPGNDRASGEVRTPSTRVHVADSRIPSALFRPGLDFYDPRAVGSVHRSESCPDGRHLFDVIESAYDIEPVYDDEGPDPDDDEIRFRACLTCVRCGLIEKWDGTRSGRRGQTTRVDPVPLVAGKLRAQQTVSGAQVFRDDPGYYGIWKVYDEGGALVGVIGWAQGPRGRHYYTGRLFAWEDETRPAEAPSALGVLRKLGRAPAASKSAGVPS